MKMNYWYSDEWCKDEHARSQEELQNIANKIRRGCKVKEIANYESYVCTIYENKNLGLRYWIKDEFGHISEIDEAREIFRFVKDNNYELFKSFYEVHTVELKGGRLQPC